MSELSTYQASAIKLQIGCLIQSSLAQTAITHLQSLDLYKKARKAKKVTRELKLCRYRRIVRVDIKS